MEGQVVLDEDFRKETFEYKRGKGECQQDSADKCCCFEALLFSSENAHETLNHGNGYQRIDKDQILVVVGHIVVGERDYKNKYTGEGKEVEPRQE